MKRLQFLFFLFALLLTFPFTITAQQLAQNYNLRQKSAFTENKGQVADQNGIERNDVKYLYSAPGLKLILKNNSFYFEVFTLEKKDKAFSEASRESALTFSPPYEGGARGGFKEPEEVTVKTHRIDVSFVGANPNPELIAEERSDNYNNYYLAHTPEEGVTNVYSYSKLTYKNLYPNIDIVFYAKEEGKLKYDIVVHPGGKLEDVKMKYDGMTGLSVIDKKLLIQTNLGVINEEIPISFLNESKNTVNIKYSLQGNILSFQGNYNNNQTLIVDPLVSWGTYYGGSNQEEGYSVKTDDSANVYLSGRTTSSSSIATSGAYQTSLGGYADVLIVKLTSEGNRKWATYFGGSGSDYGNGITIDKDKNIYIAGRTSSTSSISTSGAYQTTYGGTGDAFIAKFNNTGLRLWATYYGGNNYEDGIGITCDTSGNVLIIGVTQSNTSIASTNSHQNSYEGTQDIFIAKFSRSGTRQWGTYYGGLNVEEAGGICTDQKGNIYITGSTSSTTNIASPGAFHDYFSGTYSYSTIAFLTKFNNNGVRQWGTYMGSGNYNKGKGVSTDDSGDVYLLGDIANYSQIYTFNSHQDTFGGGGRDAFIIKMNSTGNYLWATYYGGSNEDYGTNITINSSGDIFILGYTKSTSAIASSLGVHQSSLSGDYDVYIAKFNKSGVRQWASYYGGSGDDRGLGICIDKFDNVIITGSTESSSGIATKGAFQTSRNSKDAFITKFIGSPCKIKTSLSGTFEHCGGEIASYTTTKDSLFNHTWSVVGGTILSGQGTDSINILWNKSGAPASVKVVSSIFNVCKDSVIKTVKINPLPPAITGSLRAICSGDSTKIGSTSQAGSTYLWYSKPAGFTSNISNPVVKPKTTTTFYLTETFTSTNCKKIDSVIILVDPPIDSNIISSSQTLCLGQTTATITGSKPVGGGDNTYSYIWERSFDSINWYTIPNAFGITFSPGTITQTTYYRRTASTFNCSGAQSSLSNVVKITINPLPKPNITGNKALCNKTITSYYITSGKENKVSWTVTGGTIKSGQGTDSILIEWTSQGNATVKVVETNIFGCTNSSSISVTIYPLPVANFTATRECLGATTSFTNSSALGTFYIWSFGDGDSATIANPKHTYKTAGTYQVTLIARSANGCTDTITKDVTVDPLPVSAFSTHNTCLGDSTRFTSSSTGAATYLWNFGDGNSSSLENPSHKYTTAGTFTVKLKVWNGAGCTDSVTNTVTVHPLPLAAISVFKDTTADRAYTFSSVNNAAAYLWRFGDGRSDTGKTVKHTYKNDSTYKVVLTVTDTNACVAFADTSITVFTVGINELFSPAFDLKLYPNPFSGTTTLEYNLQQRANTEISIYDLTGKEIAVLQKGTQPEGIHFITIDAGKYQLNAGIYILKILAGDQIISRQLIKLKE